MSTHDVAPPPEPKTPLWLPALGALLFILVGIWWATSPSTPAAAAPAADSADAADGVAPPAAPTAKN